MRLLYPQDPFDRKAPDEAYAEEYAAVVAAGIPTSLFSLEDFESSGRFSPRPAPDADDRVLYRGWMLTTETYALLHASIVAAGMTMITAPGQYRTCHHLPAWYPVCRAITPETIFMSEDADFDAAVAGIDWPGYFVKDYVKSLTTSRGSVAKDTQEISEIVSALRQYRGRIEGGICIRRFEQLTPGTEERYFVFNGKIFARHGAHPPQALYDIASKIDSPFYSADFAEGKDGKHWLIEIGDGQVSDRKEWHIDEFTAMLASGM